MSFSLWLLVLGCILLTLGLASAYLRLLPVSTSFIYLLFGLAIGPAGLHACGRGTPTPRCRPTTSSPWR